MTDERVELLAQLHRQSELIKALQTSLTSRNDEVNRLTDEVKQCHDQYRALHLTVEQERCEWQSTDTTRSKQITDLNNQINELRAAAMATSSISTSTLPSSSLVGINNSNSSYDDTERQHELLRHRLRAAHQLLTERNNADVERRAKLDYEPTAPSNLSMSTSPSSSSSSSSLYEHQQAPHGNAPPLPPPSSSSIPTMSGVTSNQGSNNNNSVNGSNDLPRELRIFRQHFAGKRPLHFKYGLT
jgi:chromosome segregation ATPase